MPALSHIHSKCPDVQSLLFSSLCPLPSVLLLGSTWEEIPFRVLNTLMKFPMNLLQAKQSQLSLSSQERWLAVSILSYVVHVSYWPSLCYVQQEVHDGPHAFICKAAFQLDNPQQLMILGIFHSQVQDFVLLVKLLEVPANPSCVLKNVENKFVTIRSISETLWKSERKSWNEVTLRNIWLLIILLRLFRRPKSRAQPNSKNDSYKAENFTKLDSYA